MYRKRDDRREEKRKGKKRREKKRKEEEKIEEKRREKIRVRNIISHTKSLFRKFILSLFLDSCLILVP